MIAEATDIMALVEQVRRTSEAASAAAEARRLAQDALRAAADAEALAWKEFNQAQNALVVASGGTDRSFIWGLT